MDDETETVTILLMEDRYFSSHSSMRREKAMFLMPPMSLNFAASDMVGVSSTKQITLVILSLKEVMRRLEVGALPAESASPWTSRPSTCKVQMAAQATRGCLANKCMKVWSSESESCGASTAQTT